MGTNQKFGIKIVMTGVFCTDVIEFEEPVEKVVIPVPSHGGFFPSVGRIGAVTPNFTLVFSAPVSTTRMVFTPTWVAKFTA